VILRASLYLNIALAIALVAMGFALQHQRLRTAHYATAYAKAETKAVLEAREAEQRHANEIAAIADKYEQDKRAADEAQRKLVRDLRAGTVRLQKRWSGCVSEAAASAAESDAAARDREESIARVLRAARDADDQIKRLQEVVRKDRE